MNLDWFEALITNWGVSVMRAESRFPQNSLFIEQDISFYHKKEDPSTAFLFKIPILSQHLNLTNKS